MKVRNKTSSSMYQKALEAASSFDLTGFDVATFLFYFCSFSPLNTVINQLVHSQEFSKNTMKSIGGKKF